MGQTPAKFFPWPTPYGQSPNSNVVTQAQAAPQMAQQNFLPLNPAEPTSTTAQTPNPVSPQSPPRNRLGNNIRMGSFNF